MSDEAVKSSPPKEDKESGKNESREGRKGGKPFGGRGYKRFNRDFGRRDRRQRHHPETNGSGDGVENGSSHEKEPEIEAEIPLETQLTREARDAIYSIARASGVKVQVPRLTRKQEETDSNMIKVFGRCSQEKLSSVQMTIKSLLTHVTLPQKEARVRSKGRRDGKEWFEFTHFLSIPLNLPSVQDKLTEFKNKAIEKQPDLDDTLFQVPEKIHLTMGMLSLTDDDKKNKAKELLHACKEAITQKVSSHPVKFDIQGLGCFGEAKRTRVVFGKIAGSGLEDVRKVTEALSEKFLEEGLLQKDHGDEVRLHITVMNNVFRERSARRDSRSKNQRYPRIPRFIDASQVMTELEDFSFGSDLELKEVHISTLKEMGEDGFYKPLEVLSLV